MSNPTEKSVINTPPETLVSETVEYVETEGFDEKATKKLLRRLDWHIIPFMSLIYL